MDIFRVLYASVTLAAVYCGSIELSSRSEESDSVTSIECCSESLSDYGDVELEESVLTPLDSHWGACHCVPCRLIWKSASEKEPLCQNETGCRPPPERSESG